MSDQARSRLDELITGYCVSQAVYVAAELGIADCLSAGPRPAHELARDLGVHERSLYRLLRALASFGIFVQDTDGRFALTPLAELLRSDTPGSQRTNIQMMVGQFYQSWGGLTDSVRTGQPAFDQLHGRSFFDHLAQNRIQAEIFDNAMTDRNTQKTLAMLDAYDFAGIRALADVGGGIGGMLVTLLKRFPRMRGILFDRPDVVKRTVTRSSAKD